MRFDTRGALRIRTALALSAVAMLAGCISIGGKPPEKLLTLTATGTAPAGTGATGSETSAITLVEFEAPARLDVLRVPVQINDSELAYLKDATWVERPSRLFRRLVAETLRAQTSRVVIDGDDPGVVATTRLTGVVREFGYDARTSSVVVRFDAIRMDGEGAGVTTRRFEAVVAGVAAESGPVGEALNQAANQVAGEVAAWAL
ncbi:MAG TPA: ABC-type transport auxiliary lipoprotein family protein [Lautropia sp.]|nr:ABC-type transport auxiliary lipoprotein family protein [Lautropia sp.]